METDVERLRNALKRIRDVKVPSLADVQILGDEDMLAGEKAVTIALGRCISLAHEALDPEYYGTD